LRDEPDKVIKITKHDQESRWERTVLQSYLLDHPEAFEGFVKYYEVGPRHIICERAHMTLRDMIHKAKGKVPREVALSIFRGILECLVPLHKVGFHRDLSDANVVLWMDPRRKLITRVALIDLDKFTPLEFKYCPSIPGEVTTSNVRAPECMVTMAMLNPKVDVYAATSLYRYMRGHQPNLRSDGAFECYQESDVRYLYRTQIRHKKQRIVSVGNVEDQLIYIQGLSLNPELRYTAEDMLKELQ